VFRRKALKKNTVFFKKYLLKTEKDKRKKHQICRLTFSFFQYKLLLANLE
jgi:hypothetical protein